MYILLFFREVPRHFKMHRFVWNRGGGDDPAANFIGSEGARILMWLALLITVAVIGYSLYRLGFFRFVRRLATRLRSTRKPPTSRRR